MTKTEIPTDATPYRDQDNNPSRLQHDTAKLLATIMRLTLPCRIDKLQVLACLVSAAVGDDEPENLSEFGQRVQSISHGVVLDLDGLIDPDSAGWKARIAQATEKPDDGEPHDGKP